MGRVDAGEAEEGRRDVHVGADPVKDGVSRDAGAADDHRNANIVVVHVELARGQPVLAQVEAVVPAACVFTWVSVGTELGGPNEGLGETQGEYLCAAAVRGREAERHSRREEHVRVVQDVQRAQGVHHTDHLGW